jgi:hypothetical protein
MLSFRVHVHASVQLVWNYLQYVLNISYPCNACRLFAMYVTTLSSDRDALDIHERHLLRACRPIWQAISLYFSREWLESLLHMSQLAPDGTNAFTEAALVVRVVLSNLGREKGRDCINNRLNAICSRDRDEGVVGE